MKSRVVITAAGVVSPLGNDIENLLPAKNPEAVFVRSPHDPSLSVCPAPDFDLRKWTGRFKYNRYLNRGAGFALAAALSAVRASGSSICNSAETGLFVGAGPNLDIGGEFPEIRSGDIETGPLSALWILKFLPNTAASAIAQKTGIQGENLTIATACSASLQAIGEAFRRIRDGYLITALAGGGDSRLSPGGLAAYRKARALFSGNEDPHKAARPFDRSRNGFVPGEGGAFFILENADSALMRKAEILCEVAGYGSSIDGHEMTAPDRDAKAAETAVKTAVSQAGLTPDKIDMISAHGTGTFLNDEMEADMIARLFGENPLVIALKSRMGHLAAACGAVELAVCIRVIDSGFLPKIANLSDPCRKGISFVREDTIFPVRTVLLENFGFGGQNAALVIRKWNP